VDDKRQGGAAPLSCRAVDDEQIDGVLMVELPLLREKFVSGASGGFTSLLAAPCSGPGENRDHLNNNKNLTKEVAGGPRRRA